MAHAGDPGASTDLSVSDHQAQDGCLSNSAVSAAAESRQASHPRALLPTHTPCYAIWRYRARTKNPLSVHPKKLTILHAMAVPTHNRLAGTKLSSTTKTSQRVKSSISQHQQAAVQTQLPATWPTLPRVTLHEDCATHSAPRTERRSDGTPHWFDCNRHPSTKTHMIPRQPHTLPAPGACCCTG